MYLHMLPTQRQARKVVWDARDAAGRRVIDQVFPEPLRKSTNATEMKIEFRSTGNGHAGSLWQLAGSDNIDSIVGTNPVGVVMSEYSLTNPRAWDYIRPILAENGGWCLFIYTPRGRNHGHALYEMAKSNPAWFCQRLTVDDTGVVSQEAIDDDRASGMSEPMLRQEYWCDFESPLEGAVYADEYLAAVDEGRITDAPPVYGVPVDTAWDIGTKNSTAIWFFQRNGPVVRVIDYHEGYGKGVEAYAKALEHKKREYGWEYGHHWGPHDLRVKDWSTGRTRLEVALEHGVAFKIVPQLSLEDGIQAARVIWKRCTFHEPTCRPGLDALASYQYEEDEDHSSPTKKHFKKKPLHDWASDGADAFRYLAVAIREEIEQSRPVEPRWTPTFDEQVKRMGRRHG